MGFFQRLFNPVAYEAEVEKRVEQRFEADQAAQHKIFEGEDSVWFSGGGEGSAPSKGTKELLQSYRFSPRLRSVVHRIAEHVAGCQWIVGFEVNKNGKAVMPHKTMLAGSVEERNLQMKRMYDDGTFRIIDEHPLFQVVTGGNKFHSGFQMRFVSQVIFDIKGENYWWLQREGSAVAKSALVVPPHWVVETPTANRNFFRISYGSIQEEVPPEDMVSFNDLDPYNPYQRGVGFGESLADEIDGDEYAAKFIKSMMYNRAVPVGLISLKNANKDQVKRMKAEWEGDFQGPYKAGRMKFGGGDWQYQRFQNTFEELQLIDLREEEAKIITETFGVPPEILGRIENSNRATINAAFYLFAKGVIKPRLDMQRDQLQYDLAKRYDERLVVDYISPVPEDREFKLEVMKTVPYHFTRGDWRELAGMRNRGDVDNVYMVPVNLLETGGPKLEPTKRKALVVHKANPADAAVAALDGDVLVDAVTPIFVDNVEQWGNKTLSELGVDFNFNMASEDVREHLFEHLGDRIKDFPNETTREQLADSLIEGMQSGESLDQLKKRVEEIFGEAKGYRAKAIAKTESNRSANFAELKAYEQSGVVEARKWLTTSTSPRAEHEELDGQEEPIGQPFMYAGMSAMYPGDWGVADMDINCQCTTVASKFVGEERSRTINGPEILKVFEREVLPFRRAVEAALVKAFEQQEEAVLEAISL